MGTPSPGYFANQRNVKLYHRIIENLSEETVAADYDFSRVWNIIIGYGVARYDHAMQIEAQDILIRLACRYGVDWRE